MRLCSGVEIAERLFAVTADDDHLLWESACNSADYDEDGAVNTPRQKEAASR